MPGEGRYVHERRRGRAGLRQPRDLDLQAKIDVRLSDDTVVQVKPGAVRGRDAPASASRPRSAASSSTAALPDDHPFINHEVDKKGIGRIVEDCSVNYSTTQMAEILDEIKRLGFHYATRAGVTVSVYDAIDPEGEAGDPRRGRRARSPRSRTSTRRGLITREERHRQIVDVWTRATDDVGDAMARQLRASSTPST